MPSPDMENEPDGVWRHKRHKQPRTHAANASGPRFALDCRGALAQNSCAHGLSILCPEVLYGDAQRKQPHLCKAASSTNPKNKKKERRRIRPPPETPLTAQQQPLLFFFLEPFRLFFLE